MSAKILVVDDEAPIRDLLAEYLSKNHYQVTTAATAREAARSVATNKPDLMITDVALAEGDGLELLGEIKASHPEVLVIVMTGMGYDDELVDEAKRKGASGYVSKRMPLSQLLLEIKHVLEGAKPAS